MTVIDGTYLRRLRYGGMPPSIGLKAANSLNLFIGIGLAADAKHQF